VKPLLARSTHGSQLTGFIYMPWMNTRSGRESGIWARYLPRLRLAGQNRRMTLTPGSFPLTPVDSVRVTTLIDNVSDVLMPDAGNVQRWGPVGTSGPVPRIENLVADGGKSADFLRAEHGFSILVEIAGRERTHRILFDAGVSPDGLVDNLDRLQISPESLDIIVLSHGHFDHVMGLDGLIRRLGRSRAPVIIHPDFWTRRRIVLPGVEAWELPVASRSAMEDVGFQIIEDAQPSFLLDGRVLITGEVNRTTEFETGFPIHQAWRGEEWVPDPLILDDQALIAHVEGKGLLVITGCGHAGIVNIVRYAQRLTGIDQIHAVLGGFHLTGGLFEPIIPATVDALAGFRPSVVMPAHCTGWKAVHRIARTLPDAFVQASVGTRLNL
jgi:7,8-dihydropterin-6-yl-methyl-4-(beta-D-ribofuranosyl)aminobenzene 5'-phosphate synthase